MTEIAIIEAETRGTPGKGPARAARRAGLVPGIVYGDSKDPLLINVDATLLGRRLDEPGFFARQFDVKIDGEAYRVLARGVQFHPVTDRPIHVDFLRVSADTQIKLAIGVIFQNEEDSPGLKRGGVLNVVRHDIEVVCSVAAIPDSFVVDLSGLDIGDSVHISDIAMPAGVLTTITDRDFTIATVAAPTVVVEPEVTVEGEEIEAEEAEAAEAEAEAAKPEEEGEAAKESGG